MYLCSDKITLINIEILITHGTIHQSFHRLWLHDKWLHALYHLWCYDDYPKELNEDVFRKLYEQAEYARFTPDQQLAYERSRKVYLDTYNEIEGGRIMGREEGYQWGFEDGREKGFADGREKTIAEIVKQMTAMGMDNDTIHKATGMTVETLED
ncbi:MAG: PD-(D/E)XK nuclease family transposase [Bacteroidales bacterium]|nr:PD-(D/E)XK nuclease family transposase [Bacteroidales bacterium]